MQKCWHKNPAVRIENDNIKNEIINLKNSLDLNHLKEPVSNKGQDLISSNLPAIHPNGLLKIFITI